MRGICLSWVASLVVAGCLVSQGAVSARELSFDERVDAQEAIERASYAHQIGTSRSFDEAVPRAVLVDKVRDYLARSEALDKVWSTPVTAEMLERELVRMTSKTRMPERLQELFAALKDDPFLIQECLVRPILVDRLTHRIFAYDPTIHAGARHEAEKLLAQLESGTLHADADHPARRLVVLERQELTDGEFDSLRATAPQEVAALGAIRDENGSYSLRVVLDEAADRTTIAAYLFAKRSWDDWWPAASAELDTAGVSAVAADDTTLPPLAPEGIPCDGNAWDNGILDDLPRRRSGHSAVWTGSEMLVWGGRTGNWGADAGMRYDPATDSWAEIATLGAPVHRSGPAAVWTGDEMIIWGGGFGMYAVNDGARYDPLTDSWTPMTDLGAPDPRGGFTTVWTGVVMIVWGGWQDINTGGRYDPDLDSWMATSTAGAPTGRSDHTAVWTGSRMIIWGGYRSASGSTNTGGLYDPVTNSWTPTSTFSTPVERHDHTAVWTGDEMIVWGGIDPPYLDSGGRYDPVTDDWSPMTIVGAPAARDMHTAVWTGSEMIVWGGAPNYYQTGGRYDPVSDSWSATQTIGAPDGRVGHTMIWTGDRMIVWGGYTYTGGYRQFNTGGRYDPVGNSWTPTYEPGAPDGRGYHSAVWTGTTMIVWGGGYWTGGDGLYLEPYQSGGRYYPATDSWSPTRTFDAPADRYGHTAVWAGNQMIVWGGTDYKDVLDTGGRYDPTTNLWGTLSPIGAPSARADHTAVWTGSEMIVWGGHAFSSGLATGGRYDPVGDSWTAVSTVNGPVGRSGHTSVWAGDEMIVWGGFGGNELDSGGRYDVLTDSWTATSVAGAPSPRHSHTAVWTGDEMIVWAGSPDGLWDTDTGGRYDPDADTWSPTTTVDAPQARFSHTAVWAENRMIVWGGNNPASARGGLYDPLNDRWSWTSMLDVPSGRDQHSAVWTGDRMIVWGGEGPLNDGGSYDPHGMDTDGDGFGCAVDCDDGDPDLTAIPGQVQALQFGTGGSTLEWPSLVPAAGPATRYDVVRGVVSELPVGGSGSEICLEADLAGGAGTVSLALTDGDPPSGEAYWYLVRGDNGCGAGSYGSSSAGIPRTTAACP